MYILNFESFFFFLFPSGTFEAEDAKVVYGLTHPVNSFEPILLQVLSLTDSVIFNKHSQRVLVVQKKLLSGITEITSVFSISLLLAALNIYRARRAIMNVQHSKIIN